MEEKIKKFIKEELAVSERRLEAAKVLLERRMLEDSVNRAYYSIFYAAKAMLNSLGYDAKTHSGMISEFGLRIIKEKLADKGMGVTLRRAFELRETSDYQIGAIIEESEVESLLKGAKTFLEDAEKFVSKRL
ncbi:MAG: HEPN domain-containing protein [Candidatus Aenigmarchaeota archaeon]|nr:HEPN domain-containing protein [Candidatus Aenigmarchaeota archaeon]